MNNTPQRIESLESLRGYLALWVFGGHLLQRSGISSQQFIFPFIEVINMPSYSVKVFMILSGYVIAILLERKHEKYSLFIIRRFLRLYPVLFIAITLGVMTHHMTGNLISTFWPNFFNHQLLQHFQNAFNSHDTNFTSCLVGVITMTNGLIPNHLIPYAATAFNGVVWSLSLEFQFYLVAPLLLRSLKPLNQRLICGTFLVVALVIIRDKIFPCTANGLEWSMYGAFLPLNIEYFWVGILSYYFWDWAMNAIRSSHSQQPFAAAIRSNQIHLLTIWSGSGSHLSGCR